MPIIVMTAYPTFLTREKALENGISAYVTKPFDPLEILGYIQQLFAEGTNAGRIEEGAIMKRSTPKPMRCLWNPKPRTIAHLPQRPRNRDALNPRRKK